MVYVSTVEAISHRVPNEILSEIFFYCAPSKDQPPAGIIPTWMSITHVCRRWCAVALAHAAFWTMITCQNAPLTRLMLERSRNATLAVAYRGHGHGTKGFRANFKLVEPHLKRVRDLDLVCRQDTYRTLIHTCISNDAPILETLSLSCRGGPPPIFNPNKLYLPPLPPPPTPAPGPRLRHLSLSGFPCPLASNEMTTLTAALQHMPNLTTLTIAWAHPPTPIVFVPPTSPTQRTAPLPALRALHLAGLTTHCAQFLHRVAPPPAAALDVRCMHEPALEHWADAHENLVGALHKLARDRPPFAALAIGPMRCTGATLHATCPPSPPPSLSPDADADADAPAGIVLDVHFPPQALTGGLLCAFAARVRDALPCAEIRTLSVHATIPVPAAWWRAFGAFSRIERVELAHTAAARGFVALLDGTGPLHVEREVEGEGEGEPGKAQDAGVFLRGLSALSLSNVDMLAGVPGRAGVRVYDALVRGCRARKALETLEVGRCRVRRGMVLQLSGIVGEVRWDEDEGKDWF